MRHETDPQMSIDFDSSRQSPNTEQLVAERNANSVDFSFQTRLDEKERRQETNMYERILALVDHLYR